MQRNCNARSKQNRHNMHRKAVSCKPVTEIEVLPNDNRKPASHVWKSVRPIRKGIINREGTKIN